MDRVTTLVLCLSVGKSAKSSIASETQMNTSTSVANRETTITHPKIAALSDTGALYLKK